MGSPFRLAAFKAICLATAGLRVVSVCHGVPFQTYRFQAKLIDHGGSEVVAILAFKRQVPLRHVFPFVIPRGDAESRPAGCTRLCRRPSLASSVADAHKLDAVTMRMTGKFFEKRSNGSQAASPSHTRNKNHRTNHCVRMRGFNDSSEPLRGAGTSPGIQC
jgi:hypothetical protein